LQEHINHQNHALCGYVPLPFVLLLLPPALSADAAAAAAAGDLRG
jgi:hypothetical protein